MGESKGASNRCIADFNVYELYENFDGFQVLHFEAESKAWVEFVCDCRRGSDFFRQYDLIIGSVANDKVYAAVDMYYRGIWDIERTLTELKYYEMNDQYCIVTQRFLNANLSFDNSYEVTI